MGIGKMKNAKSYMDRVSFCTFHFSIARRRM
jgi:hypothetical protein